MNKKKRYGMTFFQVELVEIVKDHPKISEEIIKVKLDTDRTIQDIVRELVILSRHGYIKSQPIGYIITKKGEELLEEFYESLNNDDDGFDADPGICDRCHSEVSYRVLFKKEHLCRDCLNS